MTKRGDQSRFKNHPKPKTGRPPMEMIAKERLNAEDVRAMCERLLREHLSLETEGYKINTSMALNNLMTAAVEKCSIEAVCAETSKSGRKLGFRP